MLIETSPLAYRGSVKGRHGAENQEQCEAFLKRKLNQLNSNIIKDNTTQQIENLFCRTANFECKRVK